MNNRERFQAILHGRAADRMPAVHFGYTPEVVKKWVQEGHLPKDLLELEDYSYELEDIISQRLGFDFGLHASRVTTTELTGYMSFPRKAPVPSPRKSTTC